MTQNANPNTPPSTTSLPSLIIPITTARNPSPNLFIEIFPSELAMIPASTLLPILIDEDAPLKVYADAALLYTHHRQKNSASEILTEACRREDTCGSRDIRVRILAAAGIAHLTYASSLAVGANASHASQQPPPPPSSSSEKKSTSSSTSSTTKAERDETDELRSLSDDRFNKATRVDQFYPMTWIGKGMLNLSLPSDARLDQARFFFETTLNECGDVLPALLGMAVVKFRQKHYEDARELYARAIRGFPERNDADTRVGFALCCYKLGQVDRAHAAFRRARALDPENVGAMVGMAILDLAGRDETNGKEFNAATERAIKLLSMAHLCNHDNAMVQNHLANHYFWKWSLVSSTARVSVKQGGRVVVCSSLVVLDPGEKIRIGPTFETTVAAGGASSSPDDNTSTAAGGTLQFPITDPWPHPSATSLQLWKKDYERVKALAKGAYTSTSQPHIQAESLFTLARVYHTQKDFVPAKDFYEQACKLAPDLAPARFGLAQTLVQEGKLDEAAAHLSLVLMKSGGATDALSTLGMLQVAMSRGKGSGNGGSVGGDYETGLGSLKKAVDLDPLNPDLVLLEAFAMQQNESHYGKSLERYKRALKLLETGGREVSWEVWTNMGVLCHETKKYEEAMMFYTKALQALIKNDEGEYELLNGEAATIKHEKNHLFWKWTEVKLKLEPDPSSPTTLILKDVYDVDSIPLHPGDHIKLTISSPTEQEFQTEILTVNIATDTTAYDTSTITLKNPLPPSESPTTLLSLQRKSTLLHLHPSLITLAFNIATLHESTSHPIPAIELHKSIIKIHPTYVNSYLRLACIARDNGSISNCSEWLRNACQIAPGDPEVLALVGNLHLSLCDWGPAQSVFQQLMSTKTGGSKDKDNNNSRSLYEAYSQLSIGTIYFNNLTAPRKYDKHLNYAADFYHRILKKDVANAYAANGLGCILAETAELIKAKDVFNRVREVSGDTIPDTLLNLGHVYLAQKRHPEALQMYGSYMSRTAKATNGGSYGISKSRDEDDAEVLLYIAFAYFDWARQTELFNDIRAAPADERYKKCVEYVELALSKYKSGTEKENVTLRYNWCRAKLQAANCVLQKLTRNIRRTAKEVEEALNGLEESLPVVKKLLEWKDEGKRIPISHNTLNDFIGHCQENIESARGHLSEERKKETELAELKELQRLEQETKMKERELTKRLQQEEELKQRDIRERKARAKMHKVATLVSGWEQEVVNNEKIPRKKGGKGGAGGDGGILAPPSGVDVEDFVENDIDAVDQKDLFDDSDDDDSDDDDNNANAKSKKPKAAKDSVIQAVPTLGGGQEEIAKGTEKDLFGDSSSDDDDDSDEELLPANQTKNKKKREVPEGSGEEGEEEGEVKKRRVMDEDPVMEKV